MCWRCELSPHAFDLVVEAEEARRKRLTAELPGRLAALGVRGAGSYGKRKPQRYELEARAAREFPKL